MNVQDHDRIKQLLQQTLKPIEQQSDPPHDLWPAMLRKLDERPVPVPWFDWALAAGLAGFVAAFPATLPLLLYYL